MEHDHSNQSSHQEHPAHSEHNTDHSGHKDAAITGRERLWLSTSTTVHCLLGCGLGEVAGMVIGTGLGLSNVKTIVLAILLGFFFGFLLGIVPLLLPKGPEAGIYSRVAFHSGNGDRGGAGAGLYPGRNGGRAFKRDLLDRDGAFSHCRVYRCMANKLHTHRQGHPTPALNPVINQRLVSKLKNPIFSGASPTSLILKRLFCRFTFTYTTDRNTM